MILLAAGAAPAAVIYKWTDAQGVVHYSDQPVPGAQRIITGGSPTGETAVAAPPAAAAPSKAPAKPPAGAKFAVLEVASPTPEQSFFGNDDIPVRLHSEPELPPNHVIAWFLNGKHLEDQGPQSTSFSLQGLPRGAYSIGATITDPESGASQSTDPVNFYVQQPSLLSPQHPRP